MIRRIIFFIIICTLFQVSALAQNKRILDSLRYELKKYEALKSQTGRKVSSLADSVRALLLEDMAREYLNFDLDSAMILARQECLLSEISGFRKGVANSYLMIGKVMHLKGDLTLAMEYYQKSLKQSEEIGYRKGIGNSYNEIGNAYYDQCKFDEGLKNHLIALNIRKEIGDKKDIGWEYWYIGLLYSEMGNYPEALKNYFTALKLHEEIVNKKGIGNIHISIGKIYYEQGLYKEALKNFNISLKIFTETGDKMATAWAYWNIGTTYSALGSYPVALNYILTGLKIFEQIGMKGSIADSYQSLASVNLALRNYPESLKNCFIALKMRETNLNTDGVADLYMLIGQVYEKQGKLKEALSYATKGLSLVRATRNKGLLKKGYATLATIHAKMGNYRSAYENELLFKQVYDSIYSKESTNRMASMQMTYEFDKIAQADSIQHANENEINLLNLQKQKTYTGAGIAGFLLVMLLLFFVYRNYTNQRKATAEMAVARRRAEQSEQFKQQFLANMSHEIRTPMNAVMGMTNLLIDKHPREDQQNYLEGIRKSSGILLHLLNDILDLAKIEAGKVELEMIDFSLREVVDQVIQTMHFKAEEKGLYLSGSVHDSIPDILTGDPVRLNQVLMNLAGNAIKFTDRGSVVIRVEPSEHVIESQVAMKFSVTDTGIGIAKDKLGSVFEEFSQANLSDTRKFGGTGLGLSISNHLVSLMNGKIGVESKPGSGSVFSFELGFKPGSDEKLKVQKESEGNIDGSILDGLSLLIADDNDYNLVVAVDTLKAKSQVTILTASNGQEAVELLKNNKIDVVLMDVQMPVMNGYEATQYIREQLPMPKKEVPVIALTASVLRSDLDLCRNAGMNSFIPKPFTASQMIKGIAEALKIPLKYSSQVQGCEREISQAEKTMTPTEPEMEKNGRVTDMTYLRKFCENDDARMQKYIAIFLDSAHPLIDKINAATENNDFKEIASQVHGHKTRFIMMGMHGTKALADQIEQQCREEGNPELIRKNVSDLLKQIQAAVLELRAT
ncbi:MAG: tetratricopeptide repeat protein [Bacteroidota bacterium]